ncbi:MAG: caspase family protein [Chitinophagales bacterium]
MSQQIIIFIYYLILPFIFLSYYSTSKAQNLHFIVFADVTDPYIGQGNIRSLELLDGLMQKIENYEIFSDIKIHKFTNQKFTNQEFDSLINNLSTSKVSQVHKNDIVFFYYLGHGQNKALKVWPNLLFEEANTKQEVTKVNLEDINLKLTSLKAQLTLTFAETCNVISKYDQNDAYVVATMPPSYKLRKKQLENLFLHTKGNIILVSTDLDQYSYTNSKSGGLFTQTLIKELKKYEYSENELKWEYLLNKIQISVERFAKNNKLEQIPYYEIVQK